MTGHVEKRGNNVLQGITSPHSHKL